MFGITLDRNRPRNVVFYGRVSTEHEAQISALENQMQWYYDIAKRFPNWTIVDRYIDEGITGTQAKKRPSFMKMIEDSKTGKFDLIVTREVCRFARNTVDTLTNTRELRNKNIEVYFVDDNIWTMDGDGELRLTIMATLAQEESRKVSERVRAGQHISRSKKILYGCGNILGYDLKRNIGDDGKWNPSENTYVINPEQAETVRMIYDLYEQGFGGQKIAKILNERKRLNPSGLIKWTYGYILKVIPNATYKGYITYFKSASNNYLEQKRILNHNKDTYEYHKGNFEPIISEEQWERCQQILNAKKKPTLVVNGETTKVSKHTSSDVWVKKLRCSCGSSFRKNRYHKDNNGVITYNYVCYNQVNYGKASARAKSGLETEGYCDERPVTEWKMNMMGKCFLNDAWKTKKEDLLLTLQYIQEYYKAETKQNSQNNVLFVEAQIDKVDKKLKNLINIYTEGDISKEEFQSMRKSYDDELVKLKEQKNSFGQQQETVEKCMCDMSAIANALSAMVDMSEPDLSKQFIDKVVTSIVPQGNKYVWNFRLDGNNEGSVNYIADGRKTCPDIHLDDCYTSSSDASSDASDLHIYSYLPSVKAHPEKSSLYTNLHRLLSNKSRLSPFYTKTIGFEEARAFRKAQGSYLRANQWNDLTVDVYLEY